MKNYLKNITFVFLVFTSWWSTAQNDAKWRVSLDVNAVDIRTPYRLSGIVKDYFNTTENDINFNGISLRLGLARKITDVWSVQASLSSNKIKKDIDWVQGNPLKDYHFYYFDTKVLYDINSLVGNTGIFDPYLGLGMGYSIENLNDFKVNGTWGFNLYLNENAGFNFESSYNHNLKGTFSLSGTGTDFFQHSLGLFVNLQVDHDADNDGVKDREDQCPQIAGIKGNYGCPEPKVTVIPDSDYDGVIDENDECPTVVGTKANKGCPEKDSDADGIADHLDLCPDVIGVAAHNGCPEPAVVQPEKTDDTDLAAIEKEFSQIAIYFDFDSDEIFPDEQAKLKIAANLIKTLSQYELTIKGHTDQWGDPKYNVALSKRRVQSVLKYLNNRGVDTSLIKIEALGSSQPVSGKSQMNRRVTFSIIKFTLKK